jgi:localization factor PodJL
VLWGALVAVAVVGGAKLLSDRERAESATTEPQAEPVAAPPQSIDPSAPVAAPGPDPFAEAPVEGVAPVEGATPGPAATPPIAQTRAGTTPASSPVVAGPLAPRNVSLEQAAQSGDLTAQYELGLQRLAGGRAQDGVTLLRRAADRGFAMAQYRLGKLYERGEGVQADLVVARQWTERAAAAGNRRAMHDLGVYFARGEGAPLDEAAAFRWFRQAAELGVADSQYNLGVLYQQGRGVNASASEAMFWFLVAARQGDQDAGARATALEAQLSPAQVQQARARGQAFRPRAASAIANGEFGPRAWARPAA